MASFTPASASHPEPNLSGPGALLAVLLLWLASGCAPTGGDFGIRLDQLSAKQTPRGISIEIQQEVRLSSEARRALQNGVPLRIRIDLALQGKSRWSPDETSSYTYEIRYLPLSEHYQLSGPGEDEPARTYPRLRHALAALNDIDIQVEGNERIVGARELRLRSHLDPRGMPGPMQLPVFLSPDWKHDSGWVSAQVTGRG
jgi:hypothetical protein